MTDFSVIGRDDMVIEAMHKPKSYLMLIFPEDKRQLSRLSLDEKMEWYAYQFEKDQRGATINLSTPEFESFWKWRVLIPTKVKRFFYRVKNGEVFKHYSHISDMKKKGPTRI